MIGVGAGYLVLLIVEQILTNSGHSHSHGTRHAHTAHAHPDGYVTEAPIHLPVEMVHQARRCRSTISTCAANWRKHTYVSAYIYI